MGFKERLALAVAFEEEVRDQLSRVPGIVAIAMNGTEHTHPDFVEQLRANDTEAAKFVRYAPDGVFLRSGSVVHYDAKVARSIERDAYETYMKYHECGCSVLVFVKHAGTIYCQYIENIRLEHGAATVERFDESQRFPVDEDGWILPRRSGRGLPGKMSGTPFRYIDFEAMKIWTPKR